MDRTDCVVVGAGVVGLAVARALALAGHEVVVLEQEPLIGSHTSARNSEVIHAGIYYPAGSAKARLCRAGRRHALRLCRGARRAAPPARQDHRRERAGAGRGARRPSPPRRAANGVDDLRPLDAARSRRAGAGAPRGRRAALALDRDHRQPRADAEPAGRGRGPWRDDRLQHPPRRRPRHRRRARDRGGQRQRRRAQPDRGADAGQRRRPLRRRGRRGDRGAGRRRTAGRCIIARAPISPCRAGCRSAT